MLPNPKNIRIWPAWLTIGILVILDWISRTMVSSSLVPGSSVSVLGNVLKITYIQNYRGLSWWVPDLPAWSRLILQGLFLFIVFAAYPVYLFYLNRRRHTVWVDIAFVGVMAACTGHLINDLLFPFTVDFIQVYHSPSANFADVYAYLGIIALVIEMVQMVRSHGFVWKGFRHWVEERKALRHEFMEYYRKGK